MGNIQTYQLQMIDSGGGGKLPIVIPSTTNTMSHVKLKNEVTNTISHVKLKNEVTICIS